MNGWIVVGACIAASLGTIVAFAVVAYLGVRRAIRWSLDR